MKSRPELLSGTCCRGHHTDGFRIPESNHQLKQLTSVRSGTWNRKLKSRTESDRWDRTRMAESGTDLDPGIGTGLDLDLDRNGTLTRTGMVSRIDGIGLVVDPGTWQELDPGLELDRNLTLDWNWTGTWPLTGTGLVSRIDEIGLVVDPGTGTYVSESDRWDRTRRGSGNLTGTWPWTGTGQELDPGLELDRNLTLTGTGQELDLDWNWNWNSKGRTVQNNTPCCGSRPPAYPSFSRMGTFFRRVKHRRSLGHRIRLRQEIQSGCRTWPLTAWLEPGPRLLGWNRDLLSLAGTGTFSAWLEPGPRLLGCNRDLLSLAGTGTFSAWLEPGPRLLGWNRDLLWIFTGSSLEPVLLCLAGTGTVKVEWESSWKPVESGFQV